MKTINQKYIDNTTDALADLRFRPKSFALDLISQPAVVQERYLDAFAQYVYTMTEHLEKHFVPLGMKQVAYLCEDLKRILLEYFPHDESTSQIMEYEG